MTTNNLKNKNDIGYFDYMKYCEALAKRGLINHEELKGKPAIDLKRIESQTNTLTRAYFNIDLHELAKVLETIPKSINFRFKINPEFKTAGDFIDTDTYLTEQNTLALFNKVLTKKRFWHKKYNAENISLMEAEYVLGFFLKSQQK